MQQPRPAKSLQQKVKKFAVHRASDWFKKFGNKRELLVEHDVDDKVDRALKVKQMFHDHKWEKMLRLPREFNPALVYEF